jgi:hypothetical protein
MHCNLELIHKNRILSLVDIITTLYQLRGYLLKHNNGMDNKLKKLGRQAAVSCGELR